MSDLSEFEVYLRTAAPPLSGLRPFVCEGSPLNCQVALVGYNPATSLSADFWDFWDAESGFDKERWFETYKQERAAEPLKEGRTRRRQISMTRQRIELFLNGLDTSCLETNLYWDASPDRASRPPTGDGPFGELLQRCPNLRLIVCHDPRAFEQTKRLGLDARTERVDHFANRKKGWGNAAALALGKEMKVILDQSN